MSLRSRQVWSVKRKKRAGYFAFWVHTLRTNRFPKTDTERKNSWLNPKAKHFVSYTKPNRNQTYRGAVVGCGRMGSTIDDEHIGMPHYPWPWAHAPAMIEARGVDLIAAADVDQAKLDDFKRRWGVEALYTDYREMVEKEQPDIVCLTTRPEPRAEVTIGLAEAGVKAIYATKPMCRTLAEADAMIDACHKHGVILAIACHLNWYNWYTNARQVIADGAHRRSLRSMICHSPVHPLESTQPYTRALSPVCWGSGTSGFLA